MKGTLVVDAPQDFQAWLKERAELAGTGTQATPPASTQRSPDEPQQQQNKQQAAPAVSPTPGG
jgi:heme/copper-type cytochrome/quinol oxidase subunit 2